MKFTPTKYAVMYHCERHPVGVSFEIDKKDAEEMSKHGTVELETTPDVVEPRRSVGRPKKN